MLNSIKLLKRYCKATSDIFSNKNVWGWKKKFYLIDFLSQNKILLPNILNMLTFLDFPTFLIGLPPTQGNQEIITYLTC